MQLAAVDRALENLRGRILTGEFAGGDRLGEVELAGELGMSRTPVRQALLRLAAEGLVEVAPNRGARVLVRSDQELHHVFELRARLEGLAARESATRATAEQIDLLDDLAHEIGVHTTQRDMAAVTELNGRFHGTLIEIADSATLATSVASLMHASVLARTQESFDDAAHRRSIAHHLEIVAAL
ncbi:MAG: GntR family transcriptional regulator, partial [Herbiconiux sp.]|nr:GntR family transcriptional regulator [Herbiconiux sp.]